MHLYSGIYRNGFTITIIYNNVMFNFILFSLSQAGIIGLTQGRTGCAWVLPSGAASETRGRGGSHEDRRRRPPTRRPTHKYGDATHRGLEEIHRQWDDDDQIPEDGCHTSTDRPTTGKTMDLHPSITYPRSINIFKNNIHTLIQSYRLFNILNLQHI